MSPISVERGRYKGWPSWHIKRDQLELVLVPEIGGRIMGLLWRGHDLFFTQPEREGQMPDLALDGDVREAKRALGFPLWGGDKTWLAPQGRWTDGVPFLDLDSGSWSLRVDRVGTDLAVAEMTSPMCRETGVQIIRKVSVSAERPDWSVTHRIHNTSAATVEWGPWSVTMVLRPADIYMPRRPNSPYPDGVKTFDAEGEAASIRDRVVSDLGEVAVIRCRDAHAFKYGVDADQGWLLAVLNVPGVGLVGFRKQVPVYDLETYGHGCIAEVYNSDRYPYLEMEAHGPVVRLGPGESFELEERQAVFDLTPPPMIGL